VSGVVRGSLYGRYNSDKTQYSQSSETRLTVTDQNRFNEFIVKQNQVETDLKSKAKVGF
jgi:hypothetical protein